MENSQSKAPANNAMGQVHAQKSSRIADAEAARLALAERLQAQLEAKASTITDVCEFFCEEARAKQAAFAELKVEQTQQEHEYAALAQANEQMSLALEAQAEGQNILSAKLEAARCNAQKLAAVTKDGVNSQRRWQATREEKLADVSHLRACHQAIEAKYAVEGDHLQSLVRDEHQQAMREIGVCAERESQMNEQIAHADQRLSGERLRGLQLIEALAADEDALRKMQAQREEQMRVQKDKAERLEDALRDARATEQRLEAQLVEFNNIARMYQRKEEADLTAQLEMAVEQLLSLFEHMSDMSTKLEAAQVTREQKAAERDALEATLQGAKETVAKDRAEKAALSNALSEAQTMLETSSVDRDEQSTRLSTAQASLHTSHGNKAGLLACLEAAEATSSAIYEEIAAIKARRSIVRAEIDKAQRTLQDLELRTSKKEAPLAACKSDKVRCRRKEFARLRAMAKTAPKMAAMIVKLRAKLAERRAKRAQEEAALDAAIAAAGEKRQSLSHQVDMACIAAEERRQERLEAERKATAMHKGLATKQATLEAANAKERADAALRAEQLAAARRALRASPDACNATKRRRAEVEPAIEQEQVKTFRLKREGNKTEAPVRKVEKEVARADAKAKATSSLSAKNAELERKNAKVREALAQYDKAKRKKEKFLTKLLATRNAQIKALKQEVLKAEATIAHLQSETSQVPQSCLKSPNGTPISPVVGTSPGKRVVFNSESELKMDTHPIQKVPTNTLNTSNTTKSLFKWVRVHNIMIHTRRAFRDRKIRGSKAAGKTQKISPKANPFSLSGVLGWKGPKFL